MFVCKAGAYHTVELMKMLHLGKLLALPTKIRINCIGLTETNTLAYCEN
jgi:hypothetical protein